MYNYKKKGMKTIETILIGLFAVFVMASCQDNNDETVPYTNGETTNVKFELDASSLHKGAITRTYSPLYDESGFGIYAFKQVLGGSDYLFVKQVSMDGMSYSGQNQKLTGSDNLPIGKYKFVSAYGVANQPTLITAPTWNNATLTDNLKLTYTAAGAMGEVFLATDLDAMSLQDYELGLDDTTNPTVTATLKRAVARVDVMFISGEKNADGTFTEKAYPVNGSNIFDNRQLETIELRFQDLNNQMTLFGRNVTQGFINKNFPLNTLDYTMADSKVVVGNGAATEIGKETYSRYDNVQSGDIISGGAHIFGTYLFPNNDATRTAGLQIYIKPVNGEGRLITISKDEETKLPLEQNKVTLVNVYVLNGNHVFSTTVDFDVTIETVWEKANEVNGSIS